MKPLNRKNARADFNKPIKIIQFGTGNFLRGFADWAFEIANEKANFNAGIQIVKNTESIEEHSLNNQEGLYHVVLNGIQNQKIVNQKYLIESVKGVINPFKNYQDFLNLALEKELKLIISNTTEQGIFFNENDSSSNKCHDSFCAKLTSLLWYRFSNFDNKDNDTIAILPCELIENNGKKVKENVLKYIQNWQLGNEFITYINNHIYFYDTLVDRIVPGFPKNENTGLPFQDNFVVKAEPYYVWYLEGNPIIKSIFPYEKAELNIRLVNQIKPYRDLKVSILNGLHTIMVPIAYFKNILSVKEVMDNKSLKDFLTQTAVNEIIPAIEIDSKIAQNYLHEIFERYENPYIVHYLSNIALNSISKFKVRVVPQIVTYIRLKQELPNNLIFVLANLIVFYKGNYKSISLPVQDSAENLKVLHQFWGNDISLTNISILLENEMLWGVNLNAFDNFSEKVCTSIQQILQSELIEAN